MKGEIADEVEQEESCFKDLWRIDIFCVKRIFFYDMKDYLILLLKNFEIPIFRDTSTKGCDSNKENNIQYLVKSSTNVFHANQT